MKGLIGILAAALITGAIYWMYFTKTPATSGEAPAQVISTVGVQTDLLSIAQAERAYQAEHGSYVTLDDLNSSGALNPPKTGRDGYTYAIDVTSGGFTATATCPTSAPAPCTNFEVDQTMQVRAAP